MKYLSGALFTILLVGALVCANYGWFILSYSALTIDMMIFLVWEINRRKEDSKTINKG